MLSGSKVTLVVLPWFFVAWASLGKTGWASFVTGLAARLPLPYPTPPSPLSPSPYTTPRRSANNMSDKEILP